MREALKLALSAIERGETFDYLESVVAPALSKALEAPMQEPVLIVDVGPDYRTSAQDPVVCKHEWFRTGAMEPGECRCIKCGAWNTTTRPAAPIEVSAGPITPEMRWPITPEKRAGLVSAMQGVFPTAQPAPVQEPVTLPCCGYTDANAITWNPFNGAVQCHNCGQKYNPPAAQRQWTEMDIDTLAVLAGFDPTHKDDLKRVRSVVNAILQLKEKNT